METDDFCSDGSDGGPEGASYSAPDESEEDEDAVGFGEDPDEEAEEAREEGAGCCHVYAAEGVGEVAYYWTANCCVITVSLCLILIEKLD